MANFSKKLRYLQNVFKMRFLVILRRFQEIKATKAACMSSPVALGHMIDDLLHELSPEPDLGYGQ